MLAQSSEAVNKKSIGSIAFLMVPLDFL
jgi:hypothetical protein